MAHIDFQIGRLVRYLQGRKLMNDTWIIFSSDHGEMLGDHHIFRKAYPFEGSAGIPLIIRPPQPDDLSGTVNDCAVNTTDTMPTILDIAGIRIPENVESDSLLPLVNGANTDLNRNFIHGEHAPVWQYVTDGKHKFAWHSREGTEWFFDLTNDPQECRNLINDPDSTDLADTWRNKLISVLEKRPGDGLVKDGRLCAGTTFPAVRPELLEET
jgi:arylsulfatase A-like enzyme